jgi:sec-independent protein translocase protein TatA
MFGIGGGELIFIIIVALMLFGTDKIPEAARTFAKIMSQVKNASNDIKSEIQKTATENGIDTSFKQITSNFTDEVNQIKNNVLENSTGTPTNPVEEVKPNLEDLTGPIKRQS